MIYNDWKIIARVCSKEPEGSYMWVRKQLILIMVHWDRGYSLLGRSLLVSVSPTHSGWVGWVGKGRRVQFHHYHHHHLFFNPVYKCFSSFHKHTCPLLHSSLLAQRECPSSMSDQWQSDQLHSVAGHKTIISLSSLSDVVCTLVLLWCWNGLPSGGWWC